MNVLSRKCLAAILAGLVGLSDSRADDKPAPASAASEVVTPKPLSDAVKKGLDYLVKQQHADGGWGQGGGEGAESKEPPGVGNTCIAVLALIRAGNTPKSSPYAKEVARSAEFICA